MADDKIPLLADEEIARAEDMARQPDGTIDPFLFGAALASPLPLSSDFRRPAVAVEMFHVNCDHLQHLWVVKQFRRKVDHR